MAVSGLGSEERFFFCFLSLAISGLEKEAHKTEEELKHARLLTHEKMEKEEKPDFGHFATKKSYPEESKKGL